MIVALDLERDRLALAEVDDAGVLARPLEHALAAGRKPLQQRAPSACSRSAPTREARRLRARSRSGHARAASGYAPARRPSVRAHGGAAVLRPSSELIQCSAGNRIRPARVLTVMRSRVYITMSRRHLVMLLGLCRHLGLVVHVHQDRRAGHRSVHGVARQSRDRGARARRRRAAARPIRESLATMRRYLVPLAVVGVQHGAARSTCSSGRRRESTRALRRSSRRRRPSSRRCSHFSSSTPSAWAASGWPGSSSASVASHCSSERWRVGRRRPRGRRQRALLRGGRALRRQAAGSRPDADRCARHARRCDARSAAGRHRTASDADPGWKSIASVVVLGVVGTAFAYLLYYGSSGRGRRVAGRSSSRTSCRRWRSSTAPSSSARRCRRRRRRARAHSRGGRARQRRGHARTPPSRRGGRGSREVSRGGAGALVERAP